MPDMRAPLPLHELRFSTRGDWASAFGRLVAHPATQLCVAQRRDLTLRVRTDDPSVLQLGTTAGSRSSASSTRSGPTPGR